MFLTLSCQLNWNNLLSTAISALLLISCSNQQLNNFSTQTLADGRRVKINSVSSEELTFIGTLSGHTLGVSSVTHSPDGKILASGSYSSYNNTVKLWNLEAMQEITSFSVDFSPVWSVAFSPDGKKLIAVGANNIKLWNIKTKKEIDFKISDAFFMSSDKVAVNPDGILAGGTITNKIKLWSLKTRKKVADFIGHLEQIYSLAFSRNGKILASGSWDKTIKLWNVETGEEIKTLAGHRGDVYTVVFSPNNKLLASGSFDDTLRLWNVETGEEIKALQRNVPAVTTLDFSPDGKTLASGSYDDTLRLWNVENMEKIATYTVSEISGFEQVWTSSIPRINSVDFSPHGKSLAVGSDRNEIIIFRVPDNLSAKVP